MGHDNRFSSFQLEGALVNSIPAHIIRLGLCTSPMLYFAINKLKLDGGIMITASHNPITENGFKLLRGGIPLQGREIKEMLSINYTVSTQRANVVSQDIKKQYVEDLMLDYSYKNTLKIAWDLGSCTTANVIHELIKYLSEHEHFLINDQVSRYAVANPTKGHYLQRLSNIVKSNDCDIGFAFDTDGDRICVLDNHGQEIDINHLFMLFLQYGVDCKDKVVIADVKMSNKVFSFTNMLGGKCILCRTGHAFIKSKMKETDAIMAVEGSGHIYFKYDDALYAAIKFISIISRENLTDMLSTLPKIHSKQITRLEINDKHTVIDQLKEYLMSHHISFNSLDGVRVTSDDGWWLVRASNTEEAIFIHCEGNTEIGLERTYQSLKLILASVMNYDY